jgi:hypothetical protein
MPDLPVYSPPCMAPSDYRAFNPRPLEAVKSRLPFPVADPWLPWRAASYDHEERRGRMRTLHCPAGGAGGNSATGSLPNEARMYKKTKVLLKCHHHQRFELPLNYSTRHWRNRRRRPLPITRRVVFQTKPECVRKQKFCENVIGRSRIWTSRRPMGQADERRWHSSVNTPHARDCHFLPASVR